MLTMLHYRWILVLDNEIPLTKAQSSQIDNDATFTKKGDKTYHGYKNHIQIDKKHKIIRDYEVTTASTHDSQEFEDLVDEEGNDSAVDSKLKAIKVAAHKGDQAMMKQCYGPYASELFGKLRKSGELLNHSVNQAEGKKCLPIAPFTCTNRNVDDFDIKTHKDYHKYTMTDKIIPTKSLNDINIIEHPDFKKQALKSKAVHKETKLQVKSESQNRILTQKLKTKVNKDDVVKHPHYTAKNLKKGKGRVVERALRSQQQRPKKARSCTTGQRKSTKQLASKIFHGTGGLDSATVDNIILSKEDLSSNPGLSVVSRSWRGAFSRQLG